MAKDLLALPVRDALVVMAAPAAVGMLLTFLFQLITASFFNGVYQPKSSLKLTLVKYLGLTIPLAVLGSLVAVEAIWVALALANLAGAIYAGRLLERWLVGNNSLLAGHNPLMDYVDDFQIVLAKLRGK